MASETEFKFAIPDAAHAQTRKYFKGAGTSKLESTYFDTDDLDLRRAGIDLRIRKDGNRLVQTIKLPSTDGGAFTRQEHEVDVVGPVINHNHLKKFLPSETHETITEDALKARYTTRFTRHKLMVPQTAPVAEAVFDVGEIIAGDSKEAISEVEFELVDTDMNAMAGICREFLDKVPAELAIESKSSRGFRLAHGTLPKPVKASIPRIAPTTPLPNAVLTLLRAGFAQFVGNIPAVRISASCKSIHQMRVGMRRLRSTISAFRSVLELDEADDLIADLKATFTLLGDVRNADVFLAETLPGIDEPLLDTRLRAELETAVTGYRERALTLVHEHLASPQFARFIVRLATWIETAAWMRDSQPLDRLLRTRTAREYAEVQLDRLHLRLLKKGRTAHRHGILAWHEARIAAKKLRYTAEPMISALGASDADTKTYTKGLKGLQSTLGKLNDLETARMFSAALIDTLPESERQQLVAAHQLLLSWASRREAELLEIVTAGFKPFEQAVLPGLEVEA